MKKKKKPEIVYKTNNSIFHLLFDPVIAVEPEDDLLLVERRLKLVQDLDEKLRAGMSQGK